MDEFLKPTVVIESNAASVVALAEDLARGAADAEAVARRCFLWVRDEVRHSSDCGSAIVTCSASEVLEQRVGFCFAKSHLLAALLRARGIPAALCYQRLALDESARRFCLHGLVAMFLSRHGWYRVDPRGDRAGISTDFCPPVERLAFTPRLPGERDIPTRFADALPSVIATLRNFRSAGDVALNLPDDERAT